MHVLQLTPYSIGPLLAMGVTLALWRQLAQKHDVPGVPGFKLTLLCIGLWAASELVKTLVTAADIKLLAYKVEIAAASMTPVGWFLFAIGYAKRQLVLPGRLVALVCAVPAITVLLAGTNELHAAVWVHMQPTYDFDYRYYGMTPTYGPWMYVVAAHSYMLAIAASAILVFALTMSRPNWRAVAAVIANPLVVCSVNAYYLSGLHPFRFFDPTTLSLTIGAAALYTGVLRGGMLNSAPVIRDRVVDQLADPVLVVDANHTVIDANASAAHVLGVPIDDLLRAPLSRFIDTWPEGTASAPTREITLGDATYHVSVSRLDATGTRSDTVLVFRDMSARREFERQLIATTGELERVLAERESHNQLLFKLQEIGGLIGWWFDPQYNRVHYTSKAQPALGNFDLQDRDVDLNGLGITHAEMRKFIEHRMKVGEAWDTEVRYTNGSGESRWYRSCGEVERDGDRIIRIVGALLDITQNKQLTERLEKQANRDPLTGLLNRRSFEAALEDAIEHCAAQEHPTYVCFLDLDQFKIVNDTSGHAAGDELLKQTAELLKRNVRSNDAIARLGGDEFGLILRNCPESAADRVTETIRAQVEAIHFHWDDHTHRIGVSIGVVPIEPKLGDIHDLQQLADAACYEAKAEGRNRVRMMRGIEHAIEKHRGETRWVQRLHDALTYDRFVLYGQGIKPLDNRDEPPRMEVLLRMIDPQAQRMIPPGAFLPVAERYGLSTKIDQWVVDHLIRAIKGGAEADEPGRRYWVNLSGSSLGDSRFVDGLIRAVGDSGLPPGTINFEITETAVIRNVAETDRLMANLRAFGCQFALDDFGSGLSSFGHLKRLPVEYLKIDGMFIKDIVADRTDRVVVQSIVDMAHTMGILTVAEFVENDATLDVLRELGVDYAQGFGVHRPEAIMADPGFDEGELKTAG